MTDESMTTKGPATELARYAERYVSERAAMDPIAATVWGIPGYDHLLPAFTSQRYERDASHTAAALHEVRAIEPIDEVDRVAKSVMLERLERRHDLESTGELARTVSVIESPLSTVRQVFELMDPAADPGAEVLTERLSQVFATFEGWRHGLRDVSARGQLPARRHLVGMAEQARIYADGAFSGIAAPRMARATRPEELETAAADADAACGELAAFLLELATHTEALEACGAERHERWARYYTGADLDLDELYSWGWEDLSRINARMWELAKVLAPDATRLKDVATRCDADDAKVIDGVEEILAQLRRFTDATVEALDGVHFDIDERIRFCDVRVAPEGSAAAPYYIEPSEDLRRSGTTWLPTLGRTRFPWWRLAATWYHEAVPGHHLQAATSLLAIDRLNRFQRQEAWTSGYGEGWALYAERLMEELGCYTDPADELGYLEGQAVRAARIVVDLGLHLGYDAPRDLGELGELGDCSSRPWTPDMAVALLEDRAIADPEVAASEVDRYLGMPAQAISYKVGERVWLTAREAAKSRLGARFDLKRFHSFALRLGPMGLDPFREAVAGWNGI
jgi:uncharacterized protein (DUF885 family)